MDHGDPRSRPDRYDLRRQARHYDRVARQIAVDCPMRVENLVEPLVIVPWDGLDLTINREPLDNR